MKGTIPTSVAVCALVAAIPAFAQETQASTSPPDANSVQGAAVSSATPEPQGLAEIVVTAQRIQESSQRAPIAVDVIKPEELVRQNVVRAEDLSRTSPALATSSGGGPTTIFFVRGVGN